MVYEANARILDPVYGCAGAISKLQKQLEEVQAELAMTQAELLFMRCQQQQLDDNAKFHRNSGSANWEWRSLGKNSKLVLNVKVMYAWSIIKKKYLGIAE